MLGKETIFEDFLYHKIKNQVKPSNENIVSYNKILTSFFKRNTTRKLIMYSKNLK